MASLSSLVVLLWFFAKHVDGFVAGKRQVSLKPLKTNPSTALAMNFMRDVQKKVNWKKARRSASIYMNPATIKLGNVVVSWEPEVAQQIVSLYESMEQELSAAGRPLMVGVVGIPGSGKSTSSDILASLCSNSIVMPMDGYHVAMKDLQNFPDPLDAVYRRGAPDTFDPSSLRKDLDRIVKGEEAMVSIPGFDHSKGDPQPNQHIFVRESHNIVVCEGIYLMHDDDGWKDTHSYFDMTIFIAADIDTCISRLKERNKCIPGYTPEEIELRCDKVDRVNAEIVERSRKLATVEVKSGCA